MVYINDLQNQKITVRLFLFKNMDNKNLIKRSIFKEKISELKSKKFSFEINRIQLPNGHEGEYGYIKHPGAALAVPITKDNKVIILRQYRFAVSRLSLIHI